MNSPNAGDNPQAEELPEWPHTAYLPIESVSAEDEHARLQLRYTTEDALALVGFTSLDLLVEHCGEHQSWISIPGNELPVAAEQAEAQIIFLDTPLPVSEQPSTEQPRTE